MTDLINNPSHYAEGFSNGAEVIDITENLNFNRGNAVKYLSRAGKKDGSPELQDLEKAQFYVNREVDRVRSIEADKSHKAMYEAIDQLVKDSMEYTSRMFLPNFSIHTSEVSADTAKVEEPIEAEFEDIPADFVPEPAKPKVGDKVSISTETDAHGFDKGDVGEIIRISEGHLRFLFSVKVGDLSQLLIRSEFTIVEEPAPRLKVGDKVKVGNSPTCGNDRTGWVSPDAIGQIGTIISLDGIDFTVEVPEENLEQIIGGEHLARVFDYIQEVPEQLKVVDREGDVWKMDEDGDVFVDSQGDDDFVEWEDGSSEANEFAPFIEILEEN